MKTIAFVPVRGDSKGIPCKNIKPLKGKPLVFWCLRALSMCKRIDEIYVATDSKLIKETVKSFDFNKVSVYDREKENAQDHSTTESVILEFLNKYKFNSKDRFILVQATSPLVTSVDFREALEQLDNEKTDSLLSGTISKRFFWDRSGKPLNYDYKNRPRRQDFDGVFQENGAFYISTVGSILKSKNRLSGTISTYIMDERSAIEVDNQLDWKTLELYMEGFRPDIENCPRIKLVLMDVDGVLTDGGMYYDQKGNELKKFNTSDGKAIEILRNYGFKVGFVTSEDTKIVKNRAKKLKVDYLFQGVTNKLDIIKQICEQDGFLLNEVAYIGDDLNDIAALKNVGMAACPSSSQPEIRKLPFVIVLDSEGGSGAVREFTRLLVEGKVT